jgi:hypothetical protein
MYLRPFAASLLLLAASSTAYADPFPLTASAPDTTATENTAPFVISDGLTQTLITNRSTLMARGLPSSLTTWDMSAFHKSSKDVFIPSEATSGAGLFRYDFTSGNVKTLLLGDGTGVRTADPSQFDPDHGDYSRLDPATWTPWGTVITGEETTGGRLFEIRNPNGNGNTNVRWLDKVPGVAHEGLRFDGQGALYFIDEDNSGSIYKFVPSRPNNPESGQTFVLSIDAFADGGGAPAQVWNSATNTTKVRTGAATWIPITDKDGVPLTDADPFAYVSATGGRIAADEVGGTPFGRPEDMTFKTLGDGNEAFFFTATSEHTVYCVELTGGHTATVRVFVNRSTKDLATDAAVGTAFTSPDNMATGSDGTIYIVEDNEPGDIWVAIDQNNNGVAEKIGRWVSLGVAGAEPTGLEPDPNDPKRFIVNIQHPDSGNDALWEIRIP